MIELRRHDWKAFRAASSAAVVPAAIQRLCGATTDRAADDAYWELDNNVVVQGRLYEAAVPTAACLAAALATCRPPARARVLELLAQLARGYADANEELHGNGAIQAACVEEISRAFGVYVGLLDIADIDEIEHCIDLIACCGLSNESLKDRAVWYLRTLRDDGGSGSSLRIFIDNWLIDLG